MSDERLSILYLAPWVGFGGSDKGTIDWFRWLDRSRFAPSLITTQPSRNPRLAEVVPFAEEIWSLPDLMVGARFPQFIADFIVSREVSVVHMMNSRLAFDLLFDIRMLEPSPKVVVQLHVEEPARDGYVRYVTTRYGNLVDAFSVSSEHLAQAVVGYGIPGDRVVVIPTGVDAEGEFCPELTPPHPGLEPGLVHILYPGRLVEQKDPLMMVEVARELHARGLAFRIHVLGGDDLEEAVRERVATYGLERRVTIEPPTRALAPWYAAADLVLMTSVFEGVPYVLYEAMAMAVPVVAPALAGNIELMGGVGGVLVEPRDRPGAYADALEPLMRDPELRLRLGREGRARMRERFSTRNMADSHGELYDRLRSRVPARAPTVEEAPDRISFLSRPSRGSPLVSVVTPCFNHGRWLRECVAAVRGQTYPQLEMIVVDDGSTERETISYLEELALESDVRLIRMPDNGGPSAARNRGLVHAAGRYILPVDADNILLPDAVESLVAQLQGAGAQIGYVYQNIQYFGNREDYFESPAFNAWLLTRQNFVDTCALIDRDVFEHGLRYPEDIVFGHEDWDFYLTLASHGIFGEPVRSKTLRYRKHGISRSDLVEWSGSQFRDTLPQRHRTLFAGTGQPREDNHAVRLKAAWAPSLTVIALAPLTLDEDGWNAVLGAARNQHFRDFELYLAADREPPDAGAAFPTRALPLRLRERPAAALAYALEFSKARHVAVTAGTGAELLGDPGSLERIVRLLECSASAHVVGFADAGGSDRYPFAPLGGDDPAIELHSLAWSRRHEALRETPPSFDDADPVGGMGRWFQLQRVDVEWRHLPALSVARAGPAGRRLAALALPPRPRAEEAERVACFYAQPALPGQVAPITRWRGLPAWIPAGTAPLVRHVRLGREEWVVNTKFESPTGFQLEHPLGILHMNALEGTGRIVRDTRQGFAVVDRGTDPGAAEMARTLGYADHVALPLLEPLLLCRHAGSGAHVLLCGDDDPLRDRVEPSPLAVLGWIDRLPVNPRVVPEAVESTAWLRGLVRSVDRPRRRHRVTIGSAPAPKEEAWELGALLDRDPGGGIPAWVDDDGRLHTPAYAPAHLPFDLRRTLRWAAAPVGWRGFGRWGPRGRAVARRSLDGFRYARARPVLPPAPSPAEGPAAWLLAEGGPDRIAIYAATHAATADQLVTRDPSEARELGYDSVQILGYALGLAPVTGSLARPRMDVPWGYRFGEDLTRAEDPHPASA